MKTARTGMYDEAAFDETPPDFRKRYFEKVDKQYKICNEVRDLVRFRRLDLFNDPYPRHMDLICCRNVIIYFSREAQHNLIDRFWTSLIDSGYLVLGKTETMGHQFIHKFERINSRERVFQKKNEG